MKRRAATAITGGAAIRIRVVPRTEPGTAPIRHWQPLAARRPQQGDLSVSTDACDQTSITEPLLGIRLAVSRQRVNVREYFDAHRDISGRAWLDASCWIEYVAGQFRVNSASGVVLVAPDDEVETARSELESLNRVAVEENSPNQSEHADSEGDDGSLLETEAEAADQFDDFHGRGAWPGPSADDAEPSDFEDSIADLGEEGVFDWDYEPDDEQ